ncbi:lysophospholipase-like protein 1 [Acropora muricata]|uniref:lysophospholipase-like protein 1 n=1 Tax=Acropora muricata TaxID=159855 RepID=UPI0034E3F693
MAIPNLKCLITRENLHQVGTLIFLHGEKYTAESMKKYLKSLLHREFEFAHIRVVFPQAPELPYFLTDIPGVFALSSNLHPKSIVFEKIRRDMVLDKNKRFPPLWM